MAQPPAYGAPGAPLQTGLVAEATADALVVDAQQHLKRGETSAAIRTLTQALKTDPVHPGALYQQALLLEKLNQRDAAIAMMQAVVLQSPEHTDAYYQLAQWMAKEGQHRAAIAAMRRVVQLHPQHAGARRHLAALYGTMGFAEHANYWVQKSVRGQAIDISEPTDTAKLTLITLHTAVAGEISINSATFGTRFQQGHMNLLGSLDTRHIRVVRFYVDTLESQPELARKLPKADAVVNVMTDAERCQAPLALADKLCDRLGLPVINPPAQVANTDRLDTYAQLKDAPEPPRLYRRLHILRGWSYELTKTIFPRSPGASCSISP